MSRYRGPRLRLFKRLGPLPGFGLKLNKKYLDQKFKKKKDMKLHQKINLKEKKNHHFIFIRFV